MPYGVTTYRGVAAVRLQNRRQDAYGRGLAGTVGSQKAEDFALIDGEGDAVDGLMFVEALVKVLCY